MECAVRDLHQGHTRNLSAHTWTGILQGVIRHGGRADTWFPRITRPHAAGQFTVPPL